MSLQARHPFLDEDVMSMLLSCPLEVVTGVRVSLLLGTPKFTLTTGRDKSVNVFNFEDWDPMLNHVNLWTPKPKTSFDTGSHLNFKVKACESGNILDFQAVAVVSYDQRDCRT